MTAPPSSGLQSMLQEAVQSVQWTYSLFWQICPQQGILIWGDGYYNGAIKTRKTVQPMEVSAEEASLQRSQQLRELYDSLSAGETNQPTRRPCAALSPEDLTESEWFYLMCISFSFPPGVGDCWEPILETCAQTTEGLSISWIEVEQLCLLFLPWKIGSYFFRKRDKLMRQRRIHLKKPPPYLNQLPGKAYTRRQHVWLTGANEVDSKTFSRAILAKSARIQTVVCIPLLEGVVEFGNTDRVQEDLGFVQHVKSFFTDHHYANPHPPKPAPSEHSTSNPATSSEPLRFHSPPIPAMYAAVDPPVNANPEDEEDEEDDEEEEPESDSEDEIVRNSCQDAAQNPQVVVPLVAEPSELMQLEMSEDIRLGSPDDGSNNLDSDFHLLAVSQVGNPADNQSRAELFRAESSQRWPLLQEPMTRGLQPLLSGMGGPFPPLDELTQEDTHYSQTVSTILQKQPTLWTESSSTDYVIYSTQSAFAKWTNRSDHHLTNPVEGASQWLLKYILFSVPFLHNKYRDESRDAGGDAAFRFRKGTPQDEPSANHVLAERRRREKLNEKFIILRSLVPFVTKMDKASILGDTIEYVKQLRKKIQDLETLNEQMEADQRSRMSDLQRTSSESGSKYQRSGQPVLDRARVGSDKRKLRIVEESNGIAKPKSVDSAPPPPPPPPTTATSVQVSIIESDALVELQCEYREGLLLDTMQILREMLIEVTAVQSALTNGVFTAQLRAKVKDDVNGKKASIVEVKRAVHQIIPQY